MCGWVYVGGWVGGCVGVGVWVSGCVSAECLSHCVFPAECLLSLKHGPDQQQVLPRSASMEYIHVYSSCTYSCTYVTV